MLAPSDNETQIATRPSPYTEYDGRKCDDPRTGKTLAIAKGLAIIVNVEGPITTLATASADDHLLVLATRYLGTEGGREYADGMRAKYADGSRLLAQMTPERWLTADFS